MKRCWLGVGILLVLLGLSLWVTAKMADIHEPLSVTVEEAGEAAQTGDWARAETLATDARSLWYQNRPFTASVADHAPMDEIDALFARLPVAARNGDGAEFADLCARLSVLLHAMAEGHQALWWNVL